MLLSAGKITLIRHKILLGTMEDGVGVTLLEFVTLSTTLGGGNGGNLT